MRKHLAILAALILSMHLSGCTSSDTNEEQSGDQAVAEESTEAVDGELDKLDQPASENQVANSDSANEGFLDEQLPEDALGESKKTAQSETPPPADVAADATTPPPAVEETKPADTTAAPTDSSYAAVDTGLTPADSTAMGSVTSSEPGLGNADTTEAKPKMASLKKIESAPFSRDGVLLNAVYIARSGDNYKKISSLIYGNEGKAKELKKLNPSVKPKVGDKVYYNSPLRTADDTKLLTYYEDKGLVNEVYIAKDGDDLKKVSKELLGNKDSWKEIWATNAIESKDKLTAGTELRYWKSEVAAAPSAPSGEIAMNNTAPPPDMAPQPVNELPPPPAPPAEMAPPPPAELPPPVAELPPPPPPPPVEAAPPPPPPPPVEAVNPPPPPPVAKKAPQVEENGMDQDMVMMLGGAGLVVVGLAAVMIVRKRRQNREMAAAFNDTQVGT